jgi:hypothetical protein
MIGTLRHIIYLVDYTPEQQVNGDWETTPAALWSGWAAAERLGDSRNLQSQQVQLLQTYQFRIREQSLPIYQNTVLVWKEWEFTISAIENEEERDRYILITGTAKKHVPAITTLLMRITEFEVGTGAAMESGDTTYFNSAFPSGTSYPIVFADGVKVPYVTGNGRSVSYNSSTKTITFSNEVSEGEIIAIYV